MLLPTLNKSNFNAPSILSSDILTGCEFCPVNLESCSTIFTFSYALRKRISSLIIKLEKGSVRSEKEQPVKKIDIKRMI